MLAHPFRLDLRVPARTAHLENFTTTVRIEYTEHRNPLEQVIKRRNNGLRSRRNRTSDRP